MLHCCAKPSLSYAKRLYGIGSIIVQPNFFSTSHSHRLFLTAGISNILIEFIIERLMKRLNYTNELTLYLKLNMRPNMFWLSFFFLYLSKLLNFLPTHPLSLNYLAIIAMPASSVVVKSLCTFSL